MLYINPEICRNRKTRESFQGLKQAKFQRKRMLKQFSLVFFVLLACYNGVNSRELKHITRELEVNAPASEAWELYRKLGLLDLIDRKLTNIFQSTEVLKGDGGVGTVVKLTFVPGNSSYTEKITVMDDQKRVKVAKGLEGDCLAIGCSVQIIQFGIIEKSQNSSIIKSIVSYAVKKEFQAKDPKPNIQAVEAILQASKKYLE
ncbi:norbelladine synthase-like [Gossypium arboreum]|uniref:norbelladine synthase-like n=1 Tax=Gossypium arboreum TaxID=29729 RepID=UPI0022F14B18|nr:norbelladine synthase-like [Gossypium arboreum]